MLECVCGCQHVRDRASCEVCVWAEECGAADAARAFHTVHTTRHTPTFVAQTLLRVSTTRIYKRQPTSSVFPPAFPSAGSLIALLLARER